MGKSQKSEQRRAVAARDVALLSSRLVDPEGFDDLATHVAGFDLDLFEENDMEPKQYTVNASGYGGLQPGVDLDSNASVAEALEVERDESTE